jgi:hypothetical protein
MYSSMRTNREEQEDTGCGGGSCYEAENSRRIWAREGEEEFGGVSA